MKKTRFAGLLACLLLLSACSGGNPTSQGEEDGVLHVLATTYPVYLFTTAVTGEAEGVEVSLLVNQQTSCLHDYTPVSYTHLPPRGQPRGARDIVLAGCLINYYAK